MKQMINSRTVKSTKSDANLTLHVLSKEELNPTLTIYIKKEILGLRDA